MPRKRGEVWYSDFTIFLDGRKQRIRESLHTTSRGEAIDLERALKERMRREIRARSPRWEDFKARYMEYAWSEKPKSALREEQRLVKVTAFFESVGIEFLDDVTPYHIDQFKAHLRAQKKPQLTQTTIRHYLQLIRGMFYVAIKWEIYTKPNPMRKVRFPKKKPGRDVLHLTTEQEAKVLSVSLQISENAKSQLQREWHALVSFVLNTGLRKSEVLGLKWRDVRGDTIRIIGKGDKEREIPLNKKALEILGSQPRKASYVFDVPNRHQPDLLRRTVLQVKLRTGIGFFSFHTLRHSFATRLLERGVDIATVAKLLGHSQYTTTLLYSHTDPAKMGEAVEKLE